MLSHIATDLYESYIEEVLKPQLGAQQSPKSSDKEGPQDPKESSEKRIRQAVYDIRYRARRENVPIESAFGQYMSHSSLSSSERMVVREKLGLAKASGASVKEEYIDEEPSANKKYKVRVTDKLSGKTYVRYATREKINKLRSNPNISSVEMTQYGDPYEGEKSKGEQTSKTTSGKGLDPVGKVDKKGDIDNDGVPASRDKNDQYLLNRRKVISNKISDSKKVKVTEEFSDWRSDLFEIVDDEIKFQEKSQIKEKKVNNNIVINPDLKIEQVQVLSTIELSEEYITESIEIASQYFYEHGLNEYGVEILIDDVGEDAFCEWVFDIAEQNFLIERKLKSGETAYSARTRERITKKPISRKRASDLKGGSAATKQRSDAARREARQASRQSSEQTPRQQRLAQLQAAQRQRNIEKAKSEQPKTKSTPTKTKGGIGSRIGSALKYASERAKKDTAKVASAAGTIAGVVHGAGIVAHRLGQEAGKSKTGQAIKKKLGVSEAVYGGEKKIPEGTHYVVTQADKTARTKAYREFLKGNPKYKAAEHLREKAESEQQQKLFGLALSVKRGQTPRSEVSTEVLKIVNTMSEKQIRKYAKTKHSGIPKKVDEAVAQISGRENNPPVGTTARQDNIQQQQLANKKRMIDRQRKLEMDAYNLQKQGKLPMGRGTMGEETKKLSALDIVRNQVIAKHGASSLMGTPENEAAREKAEKKAKKQPKPTKSNRYKDDVYSKDGLGGIRGYRSGD